MSQARPARQVPDGGAVVAANITTDEVWREVEMRSFAVLGYVTRGEAPTVGIVYAAHDRRVYIMTGRDYWKARHIASNPHVALTVTIPKRLEIGGLRERGYGFIVQYTASPRARRGSQPQPPINTLRRMPGGNGAG